MICPECGADEVVAQQGVFYCGGSIPDNSGSYGNGRRPCGHVFGPDYSVGRCACGRGAIGYCECGRPVCQSHGTYWTNGVRCNEHVSQDYAERSRFWRNSSERLAMAVDYFWDHMEELQYPGVVYFRDAIGFPTGLYVQYVVGGNGRTYDLRGRLTLLDDGKYSYGSGAASPKPRIFLGLPRAAALEIPARAWLHVDSGMAPNDPTCDLATGTIRAMTFHLERRGAGWPPELRADYD
jgi:hypothetical protein